MSVTGHDPPPARTLEELLEPVVVVLDGQRFVLRPGALATMVRFLVTRAPIVGAADYSTWTFDVTKGDVKAKVELRWGALCRPASEHPGHEPG